MFNDKVERLNILKTKGEFLEKCSEELKQDKEIVLTRVNSYGYSIIYTPYFRNDLEVIYEALLRTKSVIFYISEELTNKYGEISRDFLKNRRNDYLKIKEEI